MSDLLSIEGLRTYFDTDRDPLRRVAEEYGLYTHVRPLQDDAVVTIEREDPDPFFPDPEPD